MYELVIVGNLAFYPYPRREEVRIPKSRSQNSWVWASTSILCRKYYQQCKYYSIVHPFVGRKVELPAFVCSHVVYWLYAVSWSIEYIKKWSLCQYNVADRSNNYCCIPNVSASMKKYRNMNLSGMNKALISALDSKFILLSIQHWQYLGISPWWLLWSPIQ